MGTEKTASKLMVEESMLAVAQQFAEGNLWLATFDFERNGYTADWKENDARTLHTSRALASARTSVFPRSANGAKVT